MWTLIVTMWIATPSGAEVYETEALTGYPWKAVCTSDIEHAVLGRMSRPWVVSVVAKCVEAGRR